jgi:hypothetical protein
MGECQYQIFRAFRVAIAFVFLCLSAQADVIFSNVTGPPANDFLMGLPACSEGSEGCSQDCPNGPFCFLLAAAAFTPTGNYVMTDAQLLLENASMENSGPGSSFSAALYSSLDGLPGSSIESIGSGLTPYPPGSLVTLDLPTPILLTAGTQYWVVLMAGFGGELFWEGGGSASVPVAHWSGFPGFPPGLPPFTWTSLGMSTLQLEIDGTPVTSVPEPSSFPLIASVVIFCLIARAGAVGFPGRFRQIS